MSTKSPSPPPSPRTSSSRLSLYNISQALIRIQRIRKTKEIVSSSGPEPITHPDLSDAVKQRKLPMSRTDEFICESGVDIPKLLRASRSALFEQARKLGANALVDEEWKTSIVSPKNPTDGLYKVQVQYSANATKSLGLDPEKPVALNQAKSVPGLMRIIRRAP